MNHVRVHICVYESWWWKRVHKLKGCSDEIFFLFPLKTTHTDSNTQGACRKSSIRLEVLSLEGQQCNQ